MKKYISYILILFLLVPAASCVKPAEENVSKMKGMFMAGVSGADDILEIIPGRSKVVDVRAYADTINGRVSDVFLKFSFKGDPDAVAAYNSSHGTSYVMCPGSAFEFTSNEVMMPRYGASSTTAKLKISTAGMEDGVTYVLPVNIDKVVGTENYELSPNSCGFVVVKMAYVAPDAGNGTKDSPYNIFTLADLNSMSEKVSEGTKTYFSLQADIDMSGVKWIPLNFAEPYKNYIDFNGNGHTLSNFYCEASGYPSFFGVLYGRCYDLNFKDAVINCESEKACGVIGGYCGTTDLPGECRNVHVEGEVTCLANVRGVGGLFGRVVGSIIADSSFKGKVTQSGGATGTGGIAGWLNGTIERCWADAEVTSNANYCGGIVGYDNATSVIRDCWSAGIVKNTQRAGGILGGINKAKTEVHNCYSTSYVEANFCVGGIAGHCNLDVGSGTLPTDTEPENVVEKCIAWNDGIAAVNSDDDPHYSSGAVLGYTSIKNFLTDCYRKPDLSFQECKTQASNVLYDMPNSTPAAPMMKAEGTGQYNYPYHGKAAKAGDTLTDVAKSLGWKADVWDFSGPVPTLIPPAMGGGDENPDLDAGGQLPDFPENELYN